jgi:hypothetical protein
MAVADKGGDMAIEVEIWPKPRQPVPGIPGGPSGASAKAASGAAKPLSANFADMMAAADHPAAEPAGPKPLSANFAEMMAAADGPQPRRPADSAADSAHGLDATERSAKAIREGPRGHGGGIDFQPFGKDGFNIGDLIDVVNPLQHIPVVSSVYRWATGDEISPAAELAGGFLYGGPIGLAASAASVALTAATGEDLGGDAVAMVLGESPFRKAGLDLADAPERTWGVKGQEPVLAAAPAAGPQMAAAAQAPDAAPPTPGPTLPAPARGSGAPITLSAEQLAMLMAQGGGTQAAPATGHRTLKPLPPPGAPAKLPPPKPAMPAAAPAADEPPAKTAASEGDGPAALAASGWDKYQALLKERAAKAAAPAGHLRTDA